MQVSYNWLKEYVDIEVSPEKLAEILTKSGVAVEHVIPCNKGVSGVYAAKVLTCEQHPEADKLHLCTVSIGGEAIRVRRTQCRGGHHGALCHSRRNFARGREN